LARVAAVVLAAIVAVVGSLLYLGIHSPINNATGSEWMGLDVGSLAKLPATVFVATGIFLVGFVREIFRARK
jgi:hypothetical protein